MTRLIIILLLSLGTLSALPVYAAPTENPDYTYEEWLERYGRYLSPMAQECRDGYLDIFTGVLGKIIVVAARPLSEWTIGRWIPYPGVVALGTFGFQWLGNQISSEGLWLCWCLPYRFEVEYFFKGDEDTPDMYVIEQYKTVCCTRTAVGVSNYMHSKCASPNITLDDCLRSAWFGQSYCF